MRNASKWFLASIVLLSAIGAVAQTVATNGQAESARENGTATVATVAAARLNAPAELFMSHLQSAGLLDHIFMKAIASLAPTHSVSTALVGCNPSCTDGLVCCLCLSATCETRAQCNLDCQK
jgi:LDH2 family malate/lactate/ureidoglycolate dehydrogenase